VQPNCQYDGGSGNDDAIGIGELDNSDRQEGAQALPTAPGRAAGVVGVTGTGWRV